MKHAAEQVLVMLFVLCTKIVLPAAIIYGWISWAKGKGTVTMFAILSLVAFALATSSALLASGALLYAQFVRSFPFHDATLMQIYHGAFCRRLPDPYSGSLAAGGQVSYVGTRLSAP